MINRKTPEHEHHVQTSCYWLKLEHVFAEVCLQGS